MSVLCDREAEIFTAHRLQSPVTDYDWPFARLQAREIADHFRMRKQATPSLFDGRVLLCRNPSFHEGLWRAEYFETSFSAFLAWRDFGFPDKNVYNGFAMAALRSNDDAWLLGRMAVHTASSGQHYFPAGTPDPSDVQNNCLDLGASAARELLEETGIDAATAFVRDDWTILKLGSRIAYMREIRFDETAQNLCARIERFLENDHAPELSGIVSIRKDADSRALAMPDFMRAFLKRFA